MGSMSSSGSWLLDPDSNYGKRARLSHLPRTLGKAVFVYYNPNLGGSHVRYRCHADSTAPSREHINSDDNIVYALAREGISEKSQDPEIPVGFSLVSFAVRRITIGFLSYIGSLRLAGGRCLSRLTSEGRRLWFWQASASVMTR
jgi:hypothetical protein